MQRVEEIIINPQQEGAVATFSIKELKVRLYEAMMGMSRGNRSVQQVLTEIEAMPVLADVLERQQQTAMDYFAERMLLAGPEERLQ